jgi:two-component system response regulator MprA
MDGLSVIRQLRKQGGTGRVPQTIRVSARDSMRDVVTGLDAGADDYLTKPFALDVLLAKVRAAERRVPVHGLASESFRDPVELRFEDLTLRLGQYELQRGERVTQLTRTECALLSTLMRRARSIVPHGVLLDEGWSQEASVSFDSLYVFIRALRAKITQPGETELLHTVRGVGYTLRS